ncbi:hypothetical protein [Rossellomorea sp. YZS02]|uniref:hypothetical protein n=1 Tax=Rossellomorea sp. YZS02 TaxID=3097358 RepID=UPI002A173A84|nr:hypothetical protein [Rossellomorea sp. YZS02]MDX8342492.1 hypothetical protein [Rossellomorea sp. YZS02]
MIRFFTYAVVSSLILSTGFTTGVATLAAENDGSDAIEDGGGQGGVTWQEFSRRMSGSYTILLYRSANGGRQWKEVTYDKNGTIVNSVYWTS